MRAWASAGGANVWISTCKSSDKCEYLYSPLNLSSSSCARSEKKARRMRWKIKANLFSSCFVFVPFSYPALSLVLILTSCTSSPLVVVSANYLSVLAAFRRNWTANHNSKTITIVFCKETKGSMSTYFGMVTHWHGNTHGNFNGFVTCDVYHFALLVGHMGHGWWRTWVC